MNPDVPISFETLSGTLRVRKGGEWFTLDFPAEPVTVTGPVPGLSEAPGTEPLFTGRNRLDIIAELPSAEYVCDFDTDISALVVLPAWDVIVTAVSDLPHMISSQGSSLRRWV